MSANNHNFLDSCADLIGTENVGNVQFSYYSAVGEEYRNTLIWISAKDPVTGIIINNTVEYPNWFERVLLRIKFKDVIQFEKKKILRRLKDVYSRYTKMRMEICDMLEE